MKNRGYKVFAAIEAGKPIEEFLDKVCNTEFVKDAVFEYGEEYGISGILFYELDIPKRYDAGMIAKCIHTTGKLGIFKGHVYNVSIGREYTTMDDFVERCING